MLSKAVLTSALLAASLSHAAVIARRDTTLDDCPGYVASNVQQTANSMSATLTLAGDSCNVYGFDLPYLVLEVEYQTVERLHVKIYDQDQDVYQVPSTIFPRPTADGGGSASNSALQFSMTDSPFSFAVTRASSGETLFNTSGSPIIFESQYLRLRTQLPENPNLYGLGEDTDPFRLNTTDYIRTLWSRDAYGIPPGTNLYGNHPIYYDHRGAAGTHGVFLLSSSGMDIMINNSAETGQYLEYNTIGGVFDFYFMAGPTPREVSQQYSQVAYTPAMMPYWGFGFHQCRYGMRDVWEVAEVVANYSLADIPLETMWTDIDYMDLRRVFTLDPERFPLNLMQQLVNYLHTHQQHYVVMVDPAVWSGNYSGYNNGVEAGAFLFANGSIYNGVVWPGPTAFPDWFAPGTQGYWDNEFLTFFDPENGLDIDALWIDMNEASNFCPYPCSNPAAFAPTNGDPPTPPPVRPTPPEPIPGFPVDFQPPTKRQVEGTMMGLPGRRLIYPPYAIHDAAGMISNFTIATDIIHANGLAEYDTHNLYGTMMSTTSRRAMLARRPNDRPMVITRSTFAGAGRDVGHWLGDSFATWYNYAYSIKDMLEFAALYQVPMVGADVCGYAMNTTETLCARWATLGAFYPFYRNHGANDAIPHEFYRWPLTTAAAQNAISIRYRLLDYIYTGLYNQNQTGDPLMLPMFFNYPEDANTFGIQFQFFFGHSVLVSPVTVENSTSVDIYLPDDIFYDFITCAPVRGNAGYITLNNVDFTEIPLHIKGGSILPLRLNSANTTTMLRQQDFHIVIAPGLDGTASGSLYLDEGNAIVQPATSVINFSYSRGIFVMNGTFDYDAGVVISNITLLGAQQPPNYFGHGWGHQWNGSCGSYALHGTNIPLTGPYETRIW